MYLSHDSCRVSESNMTDFSDPYQLHTFRIEWQDDMDYELWKMGQVVLMVSSRKLLWKLHIWAEKNTYKISDSLPDGIQNPPEYEALTYTNIQLICSMTFKVTRVAAPETSVIFTHKLYRWFIERKFLKSASHKIHKLSVHTAVLLTL
jgi:hypothetical protein